MATNVHIDRTGSESPLSVIRRFSKRVQGAGIVPEVRGRRYKNRSLSKLTRKKRALKLLSRRAKYEQLLKLGKIVERKKGRGRR